MTYETRTGSPHERKLRLVGAGDENPLIRSLDYKAARRLMENVMTDTDQLLIVAGEEGRGPYNIKDYKKRDQITNHTQ